MPLAQAKMGLTVEDLDTMFAMFSKYDPQKVGTVTIPNVEAILKSLVRGKRLQDKFVKEQMGSLPSDAEALDFANLITLVTTKKDPRLEMIKSNFETFSTDANNRIAFDVFRGSCLEAAGNMGIETSKMEFHLKKLDIKKKDAVSYGEFYKFVTGNQIKAHIEHIRMGSGDPAPPSAKSPPKPAPTPRSARLSRGTAARPTSSPRVSATSRPSPSPRGTAGRLSGGTGTLGARTAGTRASTTAYPRRGSGNSRPSPSPRVGSNRGDAAGARRTSGGQRSSPMAGRGRTSRGGKGAVTPVKAEAEEVEEESVGLGINDLELIYALFRRADTHGKGTIGYDDMKSVFEGLVKEKKITRRYMEEQMSNFSEGDAIAFDQYIRMQTGINEFRVGKIKQNFETFKVSADGYIEPSLLSNVCYGLAENYGIDRLNVEMELKRADLSGDGKISFAEFYKLSTSPTFNSFYMGIKCVAPRNAVTAVAAMERRQSSSMNRRLSDEVINPPLGGHAEGGDEVGDSTADHGLELEPGASGEGLPELGIDDLDMLYNMFTQYDKDKSGGISNDELRAVFEDMLQGKKVSQAFIDEQMAEGDFDGDGNVSFAEYIKMQTGIDEPRIGKMKQNYESFKPDGEGHIETHVFEGICVQVATDYGIDAAAARAVVEKVDVNKDGNVSFAEFYKLCTDPLLTKFALSIKRTLAREERRKKEVKDAMLSRSESQAEVLRKQEERTEARKRAALESAEAQENRLLHEQATLEVDGAERRASDISALNERIAAMHAEADEEQRRKSEQENKEAQALLGDDDFVLQDFAETEVVLEEFGTDNQADQLQILGDPQPIDSPSMRRKSSEMLKSMTMPEMHEAQSVSTGAEDVSSGGGAKTMIASLNHLVGKFDQLQNGGEIDIFQLDEICLMYGLKVPSGVGDKISFQQYIGALVQDKSEPIHQIKNINRLKQYFDQYVYSGSGPVTSKMLKQAYSACMGRNIEISAESAATFDESPMSGVKFATYVMLLAMLDGMNLAPPPEDAVGTDRTKQPMLINRGESAQSMGRKDSFGNYALGGRRESGGSQGRRSSFGSQHSGGDEYQSDEVNEEEYYDEDGDYVDEEEARDQVHVEIDEQVDGMAELLAAQAKLADISRQLSMGSSASGDDMMRRLSRGSRASSGGGNHGAWSEDIRAADRDAMGMDADEKRDSTGSSGGGALSSLPSMFIDVKASQKEKGYLNILKARYDDKLRKEGAMTRQGLFDSAKRLGITQQYLSAEKIKNIATSNRNALRFEAFVHAMVIDRLNPILDLQHLNGLYDYFNEYDHDRNGTITIDELKMVFEKQIGGEMPKDMLRAIHSKADADGDGLVDFDEYVHMMQLDFAQLNQVGKVDRTEQKFKEQNASTKRLQSYMRELFHSPAMNENVSEECRVLLDDAEKAVARAVDAEIGGDMPGLLIHMITCFKLVKSASGPEHDHPDDLRQALEKCAKTVKEQGQRVQDSSLKR